MFTGSSMSHVSSQSRILTNSLSQKWVMDGWLVQWTLTITPIPHFKTEGRTRQLPVHCLCHLVEEVLSLDPLVLFDRRKLCAGIRFPHLLSQCNGLHEIGVLEKMKTINCPCKSNKLCQIQCISNQSTNTVYIILQNYKKINTHHSGSSGCLPT